MGEHLVKRAGLVGGYGLEEPTMTQRLDYQKLSAAGVRAVGGVYMYIVNSGLPKELVDLVFLRASQINGCAYCIDSHSRDLQKAGVAAEKLMLLSAWREAVDLFTAQETVGLHLGEEGNLGSVTDALHA